MKSRNVLYIVITIICVIAIVVAVYYQIFGNDERPNNIGNNNGNKQINNSDEIDLEKIKNEFNNLFTNTLNTQGNEITDIKKVYEDKELIYSIYTIKEEKEDKYNINLNLPVFNIKSTTASEYNSWTQKIFVDKANEIFKIRRLKNG